MTLFKAFVHDEPLVLHEATGFARVTELEKRGELNFRPRHLIGIELH